MYRHDSCDRHEAHLETGSCEGFGTKDENDESARGDQPDADGVTTERNAEKDEQRRDAAPYRRHLRAGQ